MNFSHSQIGGRFSVQNKMAADNVNFNNLAIEILIDENFVIFTELMEIINKQINIEEGIFSAYEFDYWIEILDCKSVPILKLDFFGCKIESISDIILDVQDPATEFTITIDISFDYYKIENNTILTERT